MHADACITSDAKHEAKHLACGFSKLKQGEMLMTAKRRLVVY
jgi:hypothetical protein